MVKDKVQVLDNTTEWYQLHGWFQMYKDKRRRWYLLGQGTKGQMLWAMKVHITMMAECIKEPEAFAGLLASYLVLSPQNEIVGIPPFYEIKPWKSGLGDKGDRIDHNMEILDKLTREFKGYTILYKGRVEVKRGLIR